MKKLNILGALILSSSLVLGACNKEEQATEKPSEVFYQDEYTFEEFEVYLVNDKNEVYASSLESENGLYLDSSTNKGYKIGDVVRGVFDAHNGEFITSELVR